MVEILISGLVGEEDLPNEQLCATDPGQRVENLIFECMICAISFEDLCIITYHIKAEHEDKDFSGQEQEEKSSKDFFDADNINIQEIDF